MIKFIKNTKKLAKVNFILVSNDLQLTDDLVQYNHLINHDVNFKGNTGSISNPISYDNCILYFVGCGSIKDGLNRGQINSIGGSIVAFANRNKLSQIDIFLESKIAKIDSIALYLAEGIKLRNYKYTELFVQKKNDNELYLKEVLLYLNEPEETGLDFLRFDQLIDGVNFTRDLISKPGNVLTPEIFANLCLDLEKIGIKVKILDEDAMKKLGMGSLLAVAQGSENKPKMVLLEWLGGTKDQEFLAIVGKGVTFDSGGINLKPSNNIADMKYDMSGAAVVAGIVKVVASQKLPLNIIGVLGLVENMPSGMAQRPGDVVTSMSGQTIEVENTDAEGRMVLADLLWYVQNYYNCHSIIDLATLTGAIVVALGDQFAGLFTNNDNLNKKLVEAGNEVNELLWRMPLSRHYDSRINSEIADMRNTGRLPGAGATTGAQFIQRFLKNPEISWAHLDIAGVVWTSNGELTQGLKGATGFGVRLLEEFIQSSLK
jgi:leucyl aminopeptidase